MYKIILHLPVSNSQGLNKNNFSYEEATYTISRVGGAESTFESGSKGKIYDIPLQEINGDTVVIKAFTVDSILSGKIGQERVKLNPEDFPHLTKEELQEATKSLPKKHLDILIRNPHLGLQETSSFFFQVLPVGVN